MNLHEFTASFAGDNQYSASRATATLTVVRVEPLKPDLIITDIWWEPKEVYEGNEVMFYYIEKNQGSVASGDFGSAIYVDGQRICISARGLLAPGESRERFCSYRWKATPGEHTVVVEADWAKEVDEANENNNKLEKKLGVTQAKQVVEIVSVSTDKDTYLSGEPVWVTVKIKNTGNVAVSGLRISVDIADPFGRNVKEGVFVDGINLEVGGERTLSGLDWIVPSDAPVGIYTVTAGLHGVPYVEKKTNFVVQKPTTRTKTRLALDLPPQIDENLVIFTGKLIRTDNGTGLSNMEVHVFAHRSLQQDVELGSARTDEQGRFKIVWEAQKIDNKDHVEIFATFKGTSEFEQSRFPATDYYFIQIEPQLRPFDFIIFCPTPQIITSGSKGKILILVFTPVQIYPLITKMPVVYLSIQGIPVGTYNLEPTSHQLFNMHWPVPATAFVSTLSIDPTSLQKGDITFTILGIGGHIEKSFSVTLRVIPELPNGAMYLMYDLFSKTIDPDYWFYEGEVEILLKKGTSVLKYLIEEGKKLLDLAVNPTDVEKVLDWTLQFFQNNILPWYAFAEKLDVGRYLEKSANNAHIDIKHLSQLLQKAPQLIEKNRVDEAISILSYTLSQVRRWRQAAETLPDSKAKQMVVNVLDGLEEFLAKNSQFISTGALPPPPSAGLTLTIEEAVARLVPGDPSYAPDPDRVIGDQEIQQAMSLWKNREPVPNTGGQVISDEKMMELFALWTKGTPIKAASASTGVALEVKQIGFAGSRFFAQGSGIKSISVQVWDLGGKLIFSKEESGSVLAFNDKTLANGVYLYVVRVRGFDGREYVSAVRKLVIVR